MINPTAQEHQIEIKPKWETPELIVATVPSDTEGGNMTVATDGASGS
jgi:hypothetical protein